MILLYIFFWEEHFLEYIFYIQTNKQVCALDLKKKNTQLKTRIDVW